MTDERAISFGLGLLIGLRHAFDVDHLVAMTTLVTERRRWTQAMRIALLWGLGHSLTFLALGVPILLLGFRLDDGVERATELLVAAMLIGLGLHALQRALRTPSSEAAPTDRTGEPTPHGRFTLRPMLIGLVHGLAGSSAAALLVLSTSSDNASGIAYLVAFAVGMVAAMTAVMAVLALAINLFARRPKLMFSIVLAAALLNIAIGGILLVDAVADNTTETASRVSAANSPIALVEPQ